MSKPRILYTMFYDMMEQGHEIFQGPGGIALMGPGETFWVWMPHEASEAKIRQFFEIFLSKHEKNLLGIVAQDSVARICARYYASKYNCRYVSGSLTAYYLPNWVDLHTFKEPIGHIRSATPADGKLISGWVSAFYTETLDVPENVLISAKTAVKDSAAKYPKAPGGNDAGLHMYVWDADDAPPDAPDGTHNSLVAMGMHVGGGITSRLNLIYVPPARRGNGFGRAIAGHLSKKIREKGQLPVLYANTKSLPANRLYSQLGFLEAGRLTQIRFI